MAYNTTAQTFIKDYLKENSDKLVTAQDVETALSVHKIEVNSSTVYRCLSRLCQSGEIIKYAANKGEMSTFQYTGEKADNCKNHLHLSCIKCNRVIHLECDFMKEISQHILNEHGFKLQCEASVLYGICDKCKETKG